MKTNSGTIHYASKSDYLNSRPSYIAEDGGVASKTSKVTDSAEKAASGVKSESKSADISERAKKLANKDNLKKNGQEIAGVGKKILEEAKDVASSTLKSPGLLNNFLGIGGDDKAKAEVAEAKEVDTKGLRPPVREPAIFFIRGFELIGLNDGGELKTMADNIPGAEYFSWQDEDKMIEEIKRRPMDKPVVLVGHGMGADSAVNIAQKLNKAEHGFRRVDLLVTMNSFGFDNDIIPQNVGKNLNFISDETSLFNDGPNIARKSDLTEVMNELRTEGHDDIVESSEVQFKIFNGINDILFDWKNARKSQSQDSKSS
jgi:hypothetical protein